MGGFNSKKSQEEDLWQSRLPSPAVKGRNDWAESTVTSYNLLDISPSFDPNAPDSPDYSPRSVYSSHPNTTSSPSTFSSPATSSTSSNPYSKAGFLTSHNDSACPKEYVPNQGRPNLPKTYYSPQKKARPKKLKPISSRPPWQNDLVVDDDRRRLSRKLSDVSDVSTVNLPVSESPPTFSTPSVPSHVSPKRFSLSSSSRDSPVKSKSDPALKRTLRQQEERFRTKKPPGQPYKPRSVSYSDNNDNVVREKKPFSVSNTSRTVRHETVAKNPPKRQYTEPTFRKTEVRSETEAKREEPPITPPKEEIKKVPKVSESKKKSRGIRSHSQPSSRSNSKSRTGEFTNLGVVKSATGSVSSNASNFNMRTKVITFNDKKNTLGSLGAAQITSFQKQFKVRTFPNGAQEGFDRAVGLLRSGEWGKEVEGLELLASLAEHDSQLLISEIGKVRSLLLEQLKNLRSQVTRSAVQCSSVVFLHLGRAMETDLEKIVRELLQKSADTNKFIRSDAITALDIMAENVSVNKAVVTVFTLGKEHKSAVVRANTARIVDSVIFRLGAERFMGSSEELQEIMIRGGCKQLQDGSLEVRQYAKHVWSELVQHANTIKLVERYITEPELRSIRKILDGLGT